MKLFICLIAAVAVLAVVPTISAATSEGGVECTACEFVVGEIEKLLANNSTQQEIIAELEKACNILPKSIAGECDTIVSTYGPELIQDLVNGENPDTLCTQIGLCSSAKKNPVKIVDSGFECTACEFVIGEIEKYLANNSTEQEIIADLEKACNILPKSIAAECDTIVSTYGPELIQDLVNGEDPDTLCTQIGLCSSAKKAAVKVVDSGFECTACEFVVGEIEKLLANNSTQQEIIMELEKVCNILPKDIAAECDTIVSTYGPELIQDLVNGENPDTLCTQIGLCSSAKKAPVKVVDSGFECTACEFVIGEIEKYLANNSTEQEIIAELEKACNILPKDIAAECDTIVSTYGPELIQDLVNGEDPDTLCTQIGLCSSAKAVVASTTVGDTECTVCEFVVGEIESLLSKNTTEAEIIMELEKVCALFGKDIGAECDTIVTTYAPELISYIVMNEDPQTACTAVGLCSSAKASPRSSRTRARLV